MVDSYGKLVAKYTGPKGPCGMCFFDDLIHASLNFSLFCCTVHVRIAAFFANQSNVSLGQ